MGEITLRTRWFTADTPSVTFSVTLVIGVFLCADGLVGLV
jgi:hypothetical protein